MRRRSLYKYFSELRWAEAFIEGHILFRSLAYFRDYEDPNIRSDQDEGTTVYRPEGGLIINNLTRQTTFTLPGFAFESSARCDEIFVLCLSRSLTNELQRRFKADTCVEIRDIGAFCSRVEASLPRHAVYPGSPGQTRIGWRVEYYQQTEEPNPRWALPDRIAIAKPNLYRWQDEFRLVFSLTDAFTFQNVDLRLMRKTVGRAFSAGEHPDYSLNTGCLRDICRLHEFKGQEDKL